ncbi:unnamed protein product [Moneuplotes crassus]|uniref:Uncharacterized protein n=1 Tax=Euplotes crassus TaxID=5936 RepID=A0AAD1XNV6_EUPCR|nr:unnamed protein product [Moneuplotes crassus]
MLKLLTVLALLYLSCVSCFLKESTRTSDYNVKSLLEVNIGGYNYLIDQICSFSENKIKQQFILLSILCLTIMKEKCWFIPLNCCIDIFKCCESLKFKIPFIKEKACLIIKMDYLGDIGKDSKQLCNRILDLKLSLDLILKNNQTGQCYFNEVPKLSLEDYFTDLMSNHFRFAGNKVGYPNEPGSKSMLYVQIIQNEKGEDVAYPAKFHSYHPDQEISESYGSYLETVHYIEVSPSDFEYPECVEASDGEIELAYSLGLSGVPLNYLHKPM